MEKHRPSSGSTPPMNIRPAALDDVPLLAQMYFQLDRDEGHADTPCIADLEYELRDKLSGEYRASLFFAEGEAVGYVLYREEIGWLHVRHFFIAPAARRRGHGRAAMDWLRANTWHDTYRIRLEVLVSNTAAIAFWKSVGFSEYFITMDWRRTQ